MAVNDELVVFVDRNGRPTGETGQKLPSHTANTKLHLAFSCYILRYSDSALLMTKRAHVKKVWPDVWTNSVCGHPGPGESMETAIQRRARYELGINEVDNIKYLVQKYVYKTPPFNGIIEHEFCPIFVAYTESTPKPNPDEVEAYEWLSWSDYTQMILTNPDKMSYWSKNQFKLIKNLDPFKSLSKNA